MHSLHEPKWVYIGEDDSCVGAMMRGRFLGGAAATVLVTAMLAGCTTAPAENIYNTAPEYCPYDSEIVQLNGDSIGAGIARFIDLPGYSKFEAAQGASNWTRGSEEILTIPDRVKQWIDQCGVPGALWVEGGIGDIIAGIPVEDLKAVYTELSDWLEVRGVPTVWLGVTPFPGVSPYQAHNERRMEFNEWLTTPGNLWGTGIDCTWAVADPSAPDVMAPRYWKIVDLFGNPDGLHPNNDGYAALADCVEPPLLATLAGQ